MTRLFWTGCAAYAVAWFWAVARLPPRVPLHFGSGGRVDDWGSRTEALTWSGLFGVLMALVLGGSILLARRGSLVWLNVPHKAWWIATPARQERLRRQAVADGDALGAFTMAVLAILLVGIVQASRQPDPVLPWWFFLAVGGYLVAVLGWVVHAYRRRYRPDPGL